MVNTRTNDVVLLWSDNTRSVYDINTLQHLRKNSTDGSGSLFLNDQKNEYQKPRDIIPIDPTLTAMLRAREEAKLTRSASANAPEKKIPAHLRLHQHFGE